MIQESKKIKHILGLSGGKDSAALAIYMRDNYPDLDIEYFFTDTGHELKEVYSYLKKLESYLGKEIRYLVNNKHEESNFVEESNFSYWLKQYNNYLPSGQQRWCTIQMKLKPLEDWIKELRKEGCDKIISYVGIRADEPARNGYIPTQKHTEVRMPFAYDGLVKQDIINTLNNTGLGLPDYYKWRSRSGCTFCFYQRKIEWVRLKETHPGEFKKAKDFENKEDEKNSKERYYWLGKGIPLKTLEEPERIAEIKLNHQKMIDRFEKRRRPNPLIEELSDREKENLEMDDMYDDVEGSGACMTCYK